MLLFLFPILWRGFAYLADDQGEAVQKCILSGGSIPDFFAQHPALELPVVSKVKHIFELAAHPHHLAQLVVTGVPVVIFILLIHRIHEIAVSLTPRHIIHKKGMHVIILE